MRYSARLILILSWLAPAAMASDYAAQVVEYVEGSGIPFDFINPDEDYNNPATALGRPTIDTTGDNNSLNGTGPAANAVPVVPVYQPFRYFEVVSIGQGGHLTLKFDHPVVDDPRNPCGIDLIVFGNANQTINGVDRWRNGDPNLMTVRGLVAGREPAKVSVSQDGATWYTYTNGPFADDFAPTLGRRYDPAHPDPALPGNLWWGAATDPTWPLSPSLTAASFTGWTVAQIAIRYGRSAGGTGFDLAASGMGWIQYVRIDNPANSGMVPEIDAMADVASRPVPDFDCDGDVDADDLAFFTACLTGPFAGPPRPGCERADADQDGDVDQVDFAVLQRCRTPSGIPADPGCLN
jgi:hypothetical protein